MKILLVSDYGTAEGGAEIATVLLRDGLRERGHDARLLASSAHAPGRATFADLECHGTTRGYRTLLQAANPWARRRLKRALAEFQPDVVHVGMFLTQLSPLILPLLRHTPSLYHAHWLRAICPTGFKMLPSEAHCANTAGVVCLRSGCLPLHDWVPIMAQLHLLERYRGVFDRVVANSAATRSALEAEGFDGVDVIPCGIADAPPRANGRAELPTVVFCGRLTRQKGAHVLLRAWETVARLLPTARLLVIGDGPQRAVLERSAPQGVAFLGALSHGEMQRMAGTAWVQAVPSIGFEPFGLVAVEAMMRGTSVVASRIGGLPEVVEHGVTGRLVEPGSHEELARTLMETLLHYERDAEMRVYARVVAQERFGASLYVDRFVAVYEGMLEKHAGHS